MKKVTYRRNNRYNSGITMLALIITVIVLIILAGISINLILGDNGILKWAKYSVNEYQEAAREEQNELSQFDSMIDGSGNNASSGNVQQRSDFNVTTPYVGTSEISVQVDTSKITETIKKYIYIVGEKVVESTEAKASVVDLEANTNYDITVVAVTNENKQLVSSITIKTEPRTYLYNNGDRCEEITGGWKAVAMTDAVITPAIIPNLTFNSDNMQLYLLSTSECQGGSLLIKNDIDYSQYKKIGICYTATLGYYNSASIVDVDANIENQMWTKEIATLCYTRTNN